MNAAERKSFFAHPSGLALLFFVEMWERFSYYGMRALLILYLVNELDWETARAANLYGSYTALVYISPLIGGFLADRLIGTRRSLVIGGVLIALGHFMLAIPGGMPTFYAGLGLVILGTGFFKPNVSTMVGQLYAPGDPRRDGGFTLFYMGINLGGFLAPLVCGYLGERVGWHYGFGAAGVGMLLGLGLYLWGRDRYLPGIGLAPSARQGGGRERAEASPDDGRRVLALALVFLFVVTFWMAFEQQGSSLNLFADRRTDRTIGAFDIPTSWFQSINSLGILVFAPLFVWLWAKLGRAGREPSTPMKMVYGLVLLGTGFAVMALAGRITDGGSLVGPGWLVATYTLHTWGELCLSPVGLSYVTKVAPARFTSLLMAAWFLANGLGNKLAGSLAALWGTMSDAAFFSIFVATSIVAAILLRLAVPLIARLTRHAADATTGGAVAATSPAIVSKPL